MAKIFKYPLAITDKQTIELPKGYKILTAQAQGSNIMLWAIVYPENEIQRVDILMYGTGHPIFQNDNREYISSVQLNGFVWHIFNS